MSARGDGDENGQLYINLYDASGNVIWDTTCYGQVDAASSSYEYHIGLAAGTYYFNVKPGFFVWSGTLKSTYSVGFTATEYCEIEPNGSSSKATSITTNGRFYQGYFGEGSESEDADYWKFSLVEGVTYKIAFENFDRISESTTILYLIDPSGESDSIGWDIKLADDDGHDYMLYTAEQTGTYYLEVWNYMNSQYSYKVAVGTTPCETHTFDSGVVTKEPTTTEEGVRTYTCTVCGTTKTEAIEKLVDTTPVRNFVERMYTKALNRDAETAGLEDWTNKLVAKTIDGAGIADGFINSTEFKNRNLSDEDYVDVLYQTFFDREADASGKADWLTKLSGGYTRQYVLAGFVNSQEFTNLCDKYGITRGTMTVSEEKTNSSSDTSSTGSDVRSFVERLYTKALGRDAEEAGAADWTNRISTGEMSAEDVAKSFFVSTEYLNKNTDDATFVETLYQTFMDRASDEAGKADWVNRLASGTTRQTVIEGFARSQEFTNILESYGL